MTIMPPNAEQYRRSTDCMAMHQAMLDGFRTVHTESVSGSQSHLAVLQRATVHDVRVTLGTDDADEHCGVLEMRILDTNPDDPEDACNISLLSDATQDMLAVLPLRHRIAALQYAYAERRDVMLFRLHEAPNPLTGDDQMHVEQRLQRLPLYHANVIEAVMLQHHQRWTSYSLQ